MIKKEDIKSIKIKFYSKFIYSPYTYIVIETKNISTPITIYLGVDLEYYDALFLKKELEKFIATEVQLV